MAVVPRRSDVLKQGCLQSFKLAGLVLPRTSKTQNRHGRRWF
ncbi:hypothetical protein HMPREF9554_00666 [Treponema phagedenis F0421]|nr:hypothetical protein HMPREF9554_00666 [Treponema phagedenis F0421]